MKDEETQLREMVKLLRITINKMENIICGGSEINSIDVSGLIESLKDDLHEVEIELHDVVN